jgi:hypothetical protein
MNVSNHLDASTRQERKRQDTCLVHAFDVVSASKTAISAPLRRPGNQRFPVFSARLPPPLLLPLNPDDCLMPVIQPREISEWSVGYLDADREHMRTTNDPTVASPI